MLDGDKAKELADHYPVGSTVSVYYHPTRPGNACLEPNLGFSHLILKLIGGLLCLLLGGFVLWKDLTGTAGV